MLFKANNIKYEGCAIRVIFVNIFEHSWSKLIKISYNVWWWVIWMCKMDFKLISQFKSIFTIFLLQTIWLRFLKARTSLYHPISSDSTKSNLVWNGRHNCTIFTASDKTFFKLSHFWTVSFVANISSFYYPVFPWYIYSNPNIFINIKIFHQQELQRVLCHLLDLVLIFKMA